MTQDNKNLFLAFGLSLLVMIGWNYFYGAPQLEKTRQQQIETQKQAASPHATAPQAGATPGPGAPTPNAPGAAPGAAPAAVAPEIVRSRAEALAASPRVPLQTKSLTGSIALKGGRIDDVALNAYHETVDKKSPKIELLSPSGAPQPFYAEFGFVGQPGATVALPKADTIWTADSQALTAGKPVTLSWDNGQGLMFRRQISVDDSYMFKVTDTVENKGGQPVVLFPYALVSRHGKPKTDGYAVLHEGFVGVVGDSGVQEFTYDNIEKETGATKKLRGAGGWLGFTDKYWAATIIPDQAQGFDGRFTSSGATTKIYQADALGEAHTIAPGASTQVTTHVFAGAKESNTIDAYQAQLGIKKFDLLIDWGWFYFITKPMFKLLDLLYKFVGNFGVAILLITVLVKLVFFPLANRSYLSMAKMKAVQPEMTTIRERFADDKVKQQQELMELYKREKINPVAGCLPILIQIPVFFALYKVLFVTIEMRQAPFFGWIRDLSAPDPTNIFTLFGLIPFDPTQIPMFGQFLHLGVWPLIMGVSMWVQMKMNPEPTDPVQKTMFAWMPVIFTFMLGSFPAGLVIYWTWNNILSVAQQALIMHRAGVKIELWDNLMAVFGKKKAA
jgi:YidC/Oxa1 family membrane protein insertase